MIDRLVSLEIVYTITPSFFLPRFIYQCTGKWVFYVLPGLVQPLGPLTALIQGIIKPSLENSEYSNLLEKLSQPIWGTICCLFQHHDSSTWCWSSSWPESFYSFSFFFLCFTKLSSFLLTLSPSSHPLFSFSTKPHERTIRPELAKVLHWVFPSPGWLTLKFF